MAEHVRYLFMLDWSLVLTPLVVKIVKVLGEGGFSFVYLAQDENSGVSCE